MNLKTGIKRIIGFIVRNGIYDKAGLKRALERLKIRGQLIIKEIAKETEPKAPPEKAVYVVLVPKGVLGNIWEFNSVHGSMEEAKKCVEKMFIDGNPVYAKNRKNIQIHENGGHTNWMYVVSNKEIPIVTVNEYFVKQGNKNETQN